MIRNFKYGSLGVLFIAGTLGMASLAIASPDMGKGSWGGDHHGMKHDMSSDAKPMMKKDWSGDKSMGMSSGHMTARLRKVWNLDLTAAQKKEIRSIQRDLRATTWEHEDAMETMSDDLFDLYSASTRDAKAIGKVYSGIFDHRRQIIEAQIEAGNKVEGVLTKEQRAKMNSWGQKPKWGSGWGK